MSTAKVRRSKRQVATTPATEQPSIYLKAAEEEKTVNPGEKAVATDTITSGQAERKIETGMQHIKAQKTLDPRILDLLYEDSFSTAPNSALSAVGSNPETARRVMLALPDFKAAVDRVAYSEDLLTRAITLFEGMTKCKLCGSNNTTFATRQMHSSDEAPTSMLYCGSCHHRTTNVGE